MKNSQFWVMFKKRINAFDVVASSQYPSQNLPSVSIIELTEDEIVYVWPMEPLYASLCLVCKNLNLHSHEICHSDVQPRYPCNFQAVPEAILSQDFDDFLADGEYLAECGYFHSFEDFKRQNGYTDENFLFAMLGSFPSIRHARQELAEMRYHLTQNK